MKTDIKRLVLLRDSLIVERENKIFKYMEGELSNEERDAIAGIVNSLTERIVSIDEKIRKENNAWPKFKKMLYL